MLIVSLIKLESKYLVILVSDFTLVPQYCTLYNKEQTTVEKNISLVSHDTQERQNYAGWCESKNF